MSDWWEGKGYVGSHGYRVVWRSCRQYLVHRLVAEKYIPNPDNLPQVNHKDRNRLNNDPSNLEWVTNQENSEHAMSVGFTVVSPEGYVLQGFNIRAFCRSAGLSPSHLSEVLNGIRKSHKGWRRL